MAQHQGETLHLDALPDEALGLVLGGLYQEHPGPCDPSSGYQEPQGKSIAALANTSHSLHDAVHRVCKEAHYLLSEQAACGREVAKHISKHAACTKVGMYMQASHVENGEALLPVAEAFHCHLSGDAGKRVIQLHLYSVANRELRVVPSVILSLAGALPSLTKLNVYAATMGPGNLFGGLAGCCPKLRELKVRLSRFSPESVDGLSSLRGLTSLALQEDEREVGQAEPYPEALLQQLSELTALTHLGVTFGILRNANRINLRRVVPPLASCLLRSLELGGSCSLMDDLPVLAATLTSLERLHISSVIWHERCTLNRAGLGAWHMPNLTLVQSSRAIVSAQAALDVAAGCPALQRLPDCSILMDVRNSTLDAKHHAVAVRNLVHGLDALAARGMLDGIELMAATVQQVDAMCAALEQLAPVTDSTGDRPWPAVAGCVHLLVAKGVVDESALGRLAVCLPCLRVVKCMVSALPALAALQHLSQVHVLGVSATGCGLDQVKEEAHEAVVGFAQRRVEALGADAAARPVAVVVELGCMARAPLQASVQAGDIVWSEQPMRPEGVW